MNQFIKSPGHLDLGDLIILREDGKKFLGESILHYQNCGQYFAQQLVKIEKEKLHTKNQFTIQRLDKLLALYEALKNYYILLGEYTITKAQSLKIQSIPQSRLTPRMDPVPTLHRDWGYGFDEIEKEISLCEKYFTPHLTEKSSILFLGAGSCHLASGLTNIWNFENSVALDQSIELLISYAKLRKGEQISVGEELLSPQSLTQASCLTQLFSAPPSHIQLLCGDFAQAKFNDETFSAVMAPWFLDILEIELNWSLSRINQLTKPNGIFLFMGPLGFRSSEYSKRYSPEELIEEGRKCGFKLLEHEIEEVPYRQIPGLGRKFTESLHFMAFRKVKKYFPNKLI